MGDFVRRPRVAVIGSLHMDIVATARRLPVKGETLPGDSLAFHPGGKAGNQAVAAHRAGGNADLLACVGDDDFGRQLRQAIREEGVGVDHVAVDRRAGTGASPVFVGEGGDYCSIIVPGSSLLITPEFVRDHQEVLRSASVVIGQLEIAPDATAEALRIGREAGATTILNAAPAPERGGLPLALGETVDVLVANVVEAAMLLETGTTLSVPIEAAVLALVQRYAIPTVILTLGGDGVLGYQSGEMVYLDAHPVSVIDTLGAGDAFIGAFAVAMAGGRGFAEALARANAAGALTVTKAGARGALPTATEIDRFLAAGENN